MNIFKLFSELCDKIFAQNVKMQTSGQKYLNRQCLCFEKRSINERLMQKSLDLVFIFAGHLHEFH